MTKNPYAADLQGTDPLVSLGQTHVRVLQLADSWSADDLARSYGPGKWTGRELLIHMVQCELVFGGRARFALTTPAYSVVPFDQNVWMPLDRTADGAAALSAYRGLRAMNLAFFRSLTADQLDHPCQHPSLGPISVRFILTSLAGHEAHHLPHFEAIGPGSRG